MNSNTNNQPYNILNRLNIPLQGVTNPKELKIRKCMRHDAIFDYNNEELITLINRLTRGITDRWQIVEKLFNFVRDSIIYDFAPRIENSCDWQASTILAKKRGFCHQKAILLVSLFRSVRIPAAMVFQTIIDHALLDTRYGKYIPNGRLPLHALAAVYINNDWYRLDATLDRELCKKRNYRLTRVTPGEETLLPKVTKNVKPHFSVESELGYFSNYPVEIMNFILGKLDYWNQWRKFVKHEHLSM